MIQHVVITAQGKYSLNLVEQLSKAIADNGCNIVYCHMATPGSEFSISMMISGTWDAIAKIESAMPKLEKQLTITIQFKRTNLVSPSKNLMPYAIDVICSDRPGVVHEITKFIADNNIDIRDMYANSYETAQTATRMYSIHMTINIPIDISIASLRGDFMQLCDQLNLDAIMEPVK